MSVYRYVPVPDLSAGIAVDGGIDRVSIETWGDLRLRLDEVPDVARGIASGMHEAAGMPAPVILERPEPRDLLAPGAGNGRSWVEVERRMSADRSSPAGVMLSVYRDSGGSTSIRLIHDEALRVALALIDAMREAESEPDPAEVEDLTRSISDALKRPVIDSSPDLNTSRAAALAALRWMRDKRRQGEGQR